MKKIISVIIIITTVLRGVIYFFIAMTIIGILLGGLGDGDGFNPEMRNIAIISSAVAVLIVALSYLLPIYSKKIKG